MRARIAALRSGSARSGAVWLQVLPGPGGRGHCAAAGLRRAFPQALFCPTGGIGRDNAADYLALPNVACVGGSWLTPADRIKAGDWDAVSALAREAAALAR